MRSMPVQCMEKGNYLILNELTAPYFSLSILVGQAYTNWYHISISLMCGLAYILIAYVHVLEFRAEDKFHCYSSVYSKG